VQTAPVERAFSMQRIVKTAWQAAWKSRHHSLSYSC